MQEDKKIIFIVGNSRSGTTLMARMLNNQGDIHISKETHYFQTNTKCFETGKSSHINELLHEFEVIQAHGIYRKYSKLNHPSFLCEAYRNGLISSDNKYRLFSDVLDVIGRRHGKSIQGDQTPQNIFYIDELIRAYENVKVVNMVRDPRAVILSQRGKWKAAKKLGQPTKEIIRSFFNYHPITLSILWNKAISAGNEAEESFGNKNLHTIKFEELVSNPESVMKSLCAFIEIEYKAEMLNVDLQMSSNDLKQTDNMSGVQSSVADKWVDKLSSAEVAIIQMLTKTNMKQYGYENIKTGMPLLIIPLALYFPLHLFVSFVFNLNRIGNPITFLLKRFK